eukprot:6629015-Pyramimonas_sp.AAC.1
MIYILQYLALRPSLRHVLSLRYWKNEDLYDILSIARKKTNAIEQVVNERQSLRQNCTESNEGPDVGVR